jgi:hypothetical protein
MYVSVIHVFCAIHDAYPELAVKDRFLETGNSAWSEPPIAKEYRLVEIKPMGAPASIPILKDVFAGFILLSCA